ncbi:histone acetyltransferase type B catalytic subunit [Magnaporthiopsis poae ATCC 64411]|uniref:Histone acetyltransferase type B catalytic subunit n=1 Tax=Magnaporthiopsis poae (strain ATCC 64411 / 73-15) TaxID=644358 RepID=A0A0C4E650_MAGP6|nr:histone acetyltransferase type B catalytic subunit [Magnaporthiopsis poae ATCC 64411]
MAEADSNWSADANACLELSLVEPSADGFNTIARFNPSFTYPIFGDDERIFGYQDLRISLRYHVADMRPHLKVKYGKKFRSVGATEPTDIEGLLREHLPAVAFSNNRDFEDAIRQLPQDWVPPGEVVSEFDANDGGTFEVRRGSLTDLAVKQILNRIQILVLFFIEGGSLIDTEDSDCDRWDIYFLFHRSNRDGASGAFKYRFAGYSTVYKFFPLQRYPLGAKAEPRQDLELPAQEFPLSGLRSRSRISQFIILPNFQKTGSGSRLYRAIYENCLRDPHVIEVTVEDPNEAFDDMRDVTDLLMLRRKPEFTALKLNTEIRIPRQGAAPRGVVDEVKAEETRCLYRIAPRQFSRVLEMHLMSKLPDSVRPTLAEETDRPRPTKAETHEYDLWKLFVKQRLYRHNKELLSQLDRSERIDKLNETLGSVELEYARLVALADRRGPDMASTGKRKLEDDADGVSHPAKKTRVDDS